MSQADSTASLQAFLLEDVGAGDLTAAALVPESRRARARLVAKAPGRVSGLDVAAAVLQLCDPAASSRALVAEGAEVHPGEMLAEWEGTARGILAAERTALNLLQRMSGIASTTARYVAAAAGTEAGIYDTRKTVPGLRHFDRQAVRAGGGRNHRWGLNDQVLIKENHLAALPPAAEGRPIEEGLRLAREHVGPGRVVEIEVYDLAEAQRAVEAGADIVLLDNFTVREVAAAVQSCGGREAKLEASGGIDLGTVGAFARTGVDRISVGALTHSVLALDISLLFEGASPGGDRTPERA